MEKMKDKLQETLNGKELCFTPGELQMIEKALRRFKAYEEIGIEPEDIIKMGMAWEDSKRYSRRLVGKLRGYKDLGPISHLRELVQAEKDGRLVVLPVKTGDTIYQLRGKRHAHGVGVSPRIVSCAHVWSTGDYSLSHQGMTVCLKKDLGKTWFLTCAEAEAALEAQKGESHETDL